jgi:hypothetical protein
MNSYPEYHLGKQHNIIKLTIIITRMILLEESRVYPRGYCSRERETEGQAARAVRGAGNAGRGASPTAGKREGFSF